MSDRQGGGALIDPFLEEGHDRAARAHHVAVAHHRKTGWILAGDVVGGDEQFVGGQLGGAIQVDGVGSLVGGEGDHLLDLIEQGGLDDVLGPVDIGLDALHGVVFGSRHLLEGRRVHHIVNPAHRHGEPVGIPHVTDEIAHAGGVEDLLHLELFQLVAGVDDQPFRLVAFQHCLDQHLAKRASAAGNQ